MSKSLSSASEPTAGAETRNRLIEVAVKHFAAHGYAAASQRAIQREAGVNPAAAHYHFGSKAALYEAVVRTFIHDVQEERVRRLNAVPRDVSMPDGIEQLLYNYFYPAIAVATTPMGYYYALILARHQGERRDDTSAIFLDVVRPVRKLYLDRFVELWPEWDRAAIEEWLTASVVLMATMPLRAPPEPDDSAESYADRHARRLARFCAAGMDAVSP